MLSDKNGEHSVAHIDYSSLKIETGVPIGPQNLKTGLTALVRRLEVGQSVLIPKEAHTGETRQAPALWGTVSYLARSTGAKFVLRTVETGVRIYRTE